MTFYGTEHRALQDSFDCTTLAATLEATIISSVIGEDQRSFIESRDFFFLATVDGTGWPTVSYKGGAPGFVSVPDDRTVVFPLYDGNGMFLSAGNIDATARIGMLFVDLETPQRLRVQATASTTTDDGVRDAFPGALLVVQAKVEAVFPNCARYVHSHRRVAPSPYVPDAEGNQPLPSWKKIDLLQPALPAHDQGRAEAEGGTISAEEYQRRLADGTS